jgi:hypothetical protein
MCDQLATSDRCAGGGPGSELMSFRSRRVWLGPNLTKAPHFWSRSILGDPHPRSRSTSPATRMVRLVAAQARRLSLEG